MSASTKLKSPDGYEINFDIRMRFFLVISCNFNPFNFIDFAEVNIMSVEGIAEFQVVDRYDDGTGYFIFRLKTNYNRDILIQGISDQFQNYFLDSSTFKDYKL